MSRELEINNASQDYIITGYNYKYLVFRKDVKSGFESGAKWADENPKSPWISVEDDLPCNHEELIIDNPLYKRTKSVVCNKPCGIRVDQMVYDMELNGWYWTGETPTHWFPAPELPKE